MVTVSVYFLLFLISLFLAVKVFLFLYQVQAVTQLLALLKLVLVLDLGRDGVGPASVGALHLFVHQALVVLFLSQGKFALLSSNILSLAEVLLEESRVKLFFQFFPQLVCVHPWPSLIAEHQVLVELGRERIEVSLAATVHLVQRLKLHLAEFLLS